MDELLPDWDDDWLEDERERLGQLHLHMLEAQADRLAADDRFGLALDVALAALRIDPFRESAHRTVIRIHLAEGNLGAGLSRPTVAAPTCCERGAGCRAVHATTRRLLHPAGGP